MPSLYISFVCWNIMSFDKVYLDCDFKFILILNLGNNYDLLGIGYILLIFYKCFINK